MRLSGALGFFKQKISCNKQSTRGVHECKVNTFPLCWRSWYSTEHNFQQVRSTCECSKKTIQENKEKIEGLAGLLGGGIISGLCGRMWKLSEHLNFGTVLLQTLRDRLVCGLTNASIKKILLQKTKSHLFLERERDNIYKVSKLRLFVCGSWWGPAILFLGEAGYKISNYNGTSLNPLKFLWQTVHSNQNKSRMICWHNIILLRCQFHEDKLIGIAFDGASAMKSLSTLVEEEINPNALYFDFMANINELVIHHCSVVHNICVKTFMFWLGQALKEYNC